jgi:hypothetical protein
MSRVGESERNRSSRCAGMRKKTPYSHRDALLCDFPNVGDNDQFFISEHSDSNLDGL